MLDRPGLRWASGEMGMGSSVRGDHGHLRHRLQRWGSATHPSPAFVRPGLMLSCR